MHHQSEQMNKSMYECEICKCDMTNNESHIVRHNNGRRHQRLAQLVLNRTLLDSFGVSHEPASNRYVCTICDVVLEVSLKKIKRHFKYEHGVRDDKALDVPILEVTKVFKPKSYYSTSYDLSKDVNSFKLIETPATMIEGMGNCVGLLRFNVIPANETPRLYCMASVLEEYGKRTLRGPKVGGSRMVMYGLFDHGQIGWFTHPQFCLYDLSEKFAVEVVRYFRQTFPITMERLDKILINEGLPEGECRFADTPFTCFSVTRDYTCIPHDDPTDYGFGIIVWLYPNGGVEVTDFPSIWLPQYHVRFKPPNGAALVTNCNSTVHCTTRTTRVDALGMAFVQKRNIITKLKTALEQQHSEIAIGYKKAKERYESRRVDCHGRHVAAPFYSEENRALSHAEKPSTSSQNTKKRTRSRS